MRMKNDEDDDDDDEDDDFEFGVDHDRDKYHSTHILCLPRIYLMKNFIVNVHGNSKDHDLSTMTRTRTRILQRQN